VSSTKTTPAATVTRNSSSETSLLKAKTSLPAARPDAKAPAPPTTAAAAAKPPSPRVSSSLKRDLRHQKSTSGESSSSMRHRSSKRTGDAERSSSHDGRSGSLKSASLKVSGGSLKDESDGTKKSVRLVSPRPGTTRERRRHTMSVTAEQAALFDKHAEEAGEPRRRVKRKGKSKSTTHHSLKRVTSTDRRKVKLRQRQTAGSRLSRKSTGGPATPAGRTLITIQCGEQKVPFEVLVAVFALPINDTKKNLGWRRCLVLSRWTNCEKKSKKSLVNSLGNH
jgi:hypothetical protein